MKRITAAVAMMTALSGCVSSQVVTDNINQKFVGQNVDAFFIEHGTPAGRYEMNSGQVLWTWDSGVKSIAVPSSTTITGNTYNGFANYNAVTTGGGNIDMRCVVQILSDAKGTILSMKIMTDTIGMWTTSMCHEVLKHKA